MPTVRGCLAMAMAAALGVLSICPATSASPVVRHGAGSRETGTERRAVLDNVVREAGIRTPDFTYSGEGIDVDKDGDEDIFISNHTRGARLWRNNGGGRFTRIARYAWPDHNADDKLIDRHHCAWADVDRNGMLDAYCTTGRTNANYVKRHRGNELWLQSRDGRFTQVGAAWHVTDICGRGRSAAFVDANGDRFPDLFVANSYPRKDSGDECNRSRHLPNEKSKLFINLGGDKFRYASQLLKVGFGLGEECIEPLDFDGDGWQDLYLCRKHGEPPALFRNRGGHGYVNVSSEHALSGAASDAAVVDLDRDKDPDLVTVAAHGVHYQLNVDGTFAERVLIGAVPTGGDGWAVAVADIDGDGDRDIYAMVGDERLSSNPDDVIWLRDGWAFTATPVPPAGGLADDIVIVRPWRSGATGLLVLNGYDKCCGGGAHHLGPIALFRWNAG